MRAERKKQPGALAVISTVGTSLLTNALSRDKGGVTARALLSPLGMRALESREPLVKDEHFLGSEEALAEALAPVLGRGAPLEASAETKAIELLRRREGARIRRAIFVPTDTRPARACARALTAHFTRGGMAAEVRPMAAFPERGGMDEALKSMVGVVTTCVRHAREAGCEVVLNATGGFKVQATVLGLVGLLEGAQVVYVHEGHEALTVLPQIPLRVDLAAIGEHLAALPLLLGPIDAGKRRRLAALPGASRALVYEENGRLRETFAALLARAEDLRRFELVGESAAIRGIRAEIARIARSPHPAIVIGPSGSGKEVVARRLHLEGPRAGHPFVPVNLAALPEQLAESELFGHEKGAFTGASWPRAGAFEQADSGTLFLDEMAKAPLALQAKLLRAIESGEVRRLGASCPRPVDVRLVVSLEAEPDALVARGLLLPDLRFRLDVHVIRLPPLCERKADIEPLARHFLARWGAPGQGFAPETIDLLRSLDYRGEVRELENLVKRATTYADGAEIRPADLGIEARVRAASRTYGRSGLREARIAFERDFVAEALKRARGSVSGAAAALHISRNHLSRRIGELGLRPLLASLPRAGEPADAKK